MSITEADVAGIEAAAVANASRGAKSVTIGDRKIEYLTPKELLDARNQAANEVSGGLFDVEFSHP